MPWQDFDMLSLIPIHQYCSLSGFYFLPLLVLSISIMYEALNGINLVNNFNHFQTWLNELFSRIMDSESFCFIAPYALFRLVLYQPEQTYFMSKSDDLNFNVFSSAIRYDYMKCMEWY